MLTSLIGVDWGPGVSVDLTTKGGLPVSWGVGFTQSLSWSKFRLGILMLPYETYVRVISVISEGERCIVLICMCNVIRL